MAFAVKTIPATNNSVYQAMYPPPPKPASTATLAPVIIELCRKSAAEFKVDKYFSNYKCVKKNKLINECTVKITRKLNERTLLKMGPT